MRLASRFGYANQIRRDRPLTHEELMHYVRKRRLSTVWQILKFLRE